MCGRQDILIVKENHKNSSMWNLKPFSIIGNTIKSMYGISDPEIPNVILYRSLLPYTATIVCFSHLLTLFTDFSEFLLMHCVNLRLNIPFVPSLSLKHNVMWLNCFFAYVISAK